MISRESVFKATVQHIDRQSGTKNNRSFQNISLDKQIIQRKQKERASSSAQKIHGENSYSQHYKQKQQQYVQIENPTSNKSISEKIINNAFQTSLNIYTQLKKRDKKIPSQNPSISSQSQKLVVEVNTSQNQSNKPNFKKCTNNISKFLQEEVQKNTLKTSLDLKREKLKTECQGEGDAKKKVKSSSCVYNQQANIEHQLIYDRTLYKNDVSFPTKEQISKKIADLVKQVISNSSEKSIANPQQNSKQMKNEDIQLGFLKEGVQEYPQKEILKQEYLCYKSTLQQGQKIPIQSNQNFHKLQDTQASSQQTIKHVGENRNSQLNFSNLSKTYSQQFSQCLSPKYSSRDNLNYIFSPRNGSQEKINLQNVQKEIYPSNTEENMLANSGQIYKKDKKTSIEHNLYSIQSSRIRNDSNGSRGSLKFNEMRNQKKQMKSSGDSIISPHSPKQEYERLKNQIQQIEVLQDLMDSPSSNRNKIVIKSYGNTDDTIQETIPTVRSTQGEDIFCTINSSNLKTQVSDDKNLRRKISSAIKGKYKLMLSDDQILFKIKNLEPCTPSKEFNKEGKKFIKLNIDHNLKYVKNDDQAAKVNKISSPKLLEQQIEQQLRLKNNIISSIDLGLQQSNKLTSPNNKSNSSQKLLNSADSINHLSTMSQQQDTIKLDLIRKLLKQSMPNQQKKEDQFLHKNIIQSPIQQKNNYKTFQQIDKQILQTKKESTFSNITQSFQKSSIQQGQASYIASTHRKNNSNLGPCIAK